MPLLIFSEMNNSMDEMMWPRPAQATGLLLTMCACPFVTHKIDHQSVERSNAQNHDYTIGASLIIVIR